MMVDIAPVFRFLLALALVAAAPLPAGEPGAPGGERKLLETAAKEFRLIEDRAAKAGIFSGRQDALTRYDVALRSLDQTIDTLGLGPVPARKSLAVTLHRIRNLGLYFPFHSMAPDDREELMERYSEAEDLLLTVLLVLDRDIAKHANGSWRFVDKTWTMTAKMDWRLANQACRSMLSADQKPCALPSSFEMKSLLPVIRSVVYNPVFALDTVRAGRVWVRDELPLVKTPFTLDTATGQIRVGDPDEHLPVLCVCAED